MIDYLTHPKFVNYDCKQLPSAQGGGGGMGVKTFRVLEALRDTYPKTNSITNATEITADTVFIEPLRFTLATESFTSIPHQPVKVLIDTLRHSKAKKILYCSDMTLLRMPPPLRHDVLEICDLVTCNSQFLVNAFKYIGIICNHILIDPIPSLFEPPGDYLHRDAMVVAMGNVSWEKNSPQVSAVFKRLKGRVKTCYIGSASLWHENTTNPVAKRLEEELFANADTVIREATTPDVAAILTKARFGLWVAYHDTYATATHEMIMSGLATISARHGLASALPLDIQSGVENQANAIVRLLDRSNDELEANAKQLTAWANANVSYAAFQKQVASILKTIW